MTHPPRLPPCSVQLYDLPRGQARRQTGRCSYGDVTGIVFSPDGNRLLTSGWDGDICLWESATGKELARWSQWPRRNGVIAGLAFRNDGKTAFKVYDRFWLQERYQTRVFWWDPVSGKTLGEWEAPGRFAGFSPQGNYAAFHGSWGTLHIREARSGKEVAVLRGGRNDFRRVAFAPDETALASVGHDSTVLVWDLPPPRGRR